MADKNCQVDAQVLNELQMALLHSHWQGATEEWLLAVVREDCAKWRAGRLPAAPAAAKAVQYKAKRIKVVEALDVPGAFMCEHVDTVNGSTQPGHLVLCDACGDKIVCAIVEYVGPDFVLTTSMRDGWVKQPRAAGAGR